MEQHSRNKFMMEIRKFICIFAQMRKIFSLKQVLSEFSLVKKYKYYYSSSVYEVNYSQGVPKIKSLIFPVKMR